MQLEKDFLYQQYIELNKSQRDIAKMLDVTEGTVDYWTRKYGLQYKRSDPDKVFQLTYIDNKDPIFCYYAGLVATDGYLDYKNKRISLRVCNRGSYEVLDALRNYFSFKPPVHVYVPKATGHPNYELLIPNTCIFKELDLMGIHGLKCTRTFDFGWFNSVSQDAQRMFLRGVLDGDGNIKKSDGVFRIAMQSVNFIDTLIVCINAILKANYQRSYQSNSTHKQYPALFLKKYDSRRFYQFVYEGFSEYRFADKYEKYINCIS